MLGQPVAVGRAQEALAVERDDAAVVLPTQEPAHALDHAGHARQRHGHLEAVARVLVQMLDQELRAGIEGGQARADDGDRAQPESGGVDALGEGAARDREECDVVTPAQPLEQAGAVVLTVVRMLALGHVTACREQRQQPLELREARDQDQGVAGCLREQVAQRSRDARLLSVPVRVTCRDARFDHDPQALAGRGSQHARVPASVGVDSELPRVEVEGRQRRREAHAGRGAAQHTPQQRGGVEAPAFESRLAAGAHRDVGEAAGGDVAPVGGLPRELEEGRVGPLGELALEQVQRLAHAGVDVGQEPER